MRGEDSPVITLEVDHWRARHPSDGGGEKGGGGGLSNSSAGEGGGGGGIIEEIFRINCISISLKRELSVLIVSACRAPGT